MSSRGRLNEDEEQLIHDGPSAFDIDPAAPLHRILQPLTDNEVKEQEKRYGKNVIVVSRRVTWYSILFSALFHPFNILLGILAAGSAGMGDLKAMSVMIVMVVISMLIRFIQEWKSAREAESLKKLISNKVTVMRYFAVRDSDTDSVSSRSSFLTNASSSSRMEIATMEILIEDLVPGDWVKLSAGDLIPADILLVESNDLFVSQASLTGEAIPVEKFANPETIQHTRGNMTVNFSPEELSISYTTLRAATTFRKSCKTTIADFFRNLFGLPVERLHDIDTSIRAEMDNPSLCYMGTAAVSGTAIAIVKYTGSRTYFGCMALELAKHRPHNAFQLGVRRISWIFFLAMAALVPPIFLLQGFLHTGDGWYEAALFALSAAVGLTPEMLPMIVSSTLARGAYLMSKKKCIVKNLDSIINMGGMDVLCTDKTGTLTDSRVSLVRHVDYHGNTSLIPIQLAFLNSHFQTGLNNLMDKAVVDFFKKRLTNHYTRRRNPLVAAFKKVNEIPFDFIRRRMSVLLHSTSANGPNLLITKGAVEEMLSICSHVYLGEGDGNDRSSDDGPTPESSQSTRPEILPISTIRIEELNSFSNQSLMTLNNTLNENGLRVIAVAFKTFPTGSEALQKSDESEMIFAGFIAFQDPPKQSTLPAIQRLLQNNVQVKVLTGDSAVVCRKICEDIKLHVTGIVTSADLQGATDQEICNIVENGTIFAKLTPLQKAQVVRALKINNHVVGFLGDGINDANALMEADIGISVDNGTEIARESADIILLEKDLMVVADGVSQGRLTYGNTLKYIVMAISSNFGNAFSLIVASAWFPFTPMLPIQLLTQNLLYDISQTAIPWDKMDPEFLTIPHRWSMKSVLKFMICFGPWSSVFDVTFFCYMYFYYGITGAPGDDLAFFRTTWFNIGILTQTFIVHLLRTPKVPFIQSMASVQMLIMTFLIIVIAISLPWIPYVSDSLEFVHLPAIIYPFIFLELVAYCMTTQIVKVIYIKCFKEWF